MPPCHSDIEGDALIVAGPTCSGKSALALALARALGGIVINADSMQVYRELHVLTARPTAADEALCPHRLYGVRAACEPGSVAWWRTEALACLREAWAQGRLPILCGGTGLYFRALTDGLAAIPDAGAAARTEARALLAAIGPAALHERLQALDPDTAAGIRASDGQRLARAWEVLAGTGQGLSAWQRVPGLPPAPARFAALRLAPPRAELRAAIAERFCDMLAQGALDEVAALLALGLPASLPAMRAHGVPELAGVLRHGDRLEDAARRAVLAQGQYTKRQATWFAHHRLAVAQRSDIITQRIANMTQLPRIRWQEILSFVQSRVDAPREARP
ncbi:tRNA (adenosine(37)-N6)-dimethylallyltransferase MiaA [Lichenicoccus sp.]|uniref:tRNA (adenosine(37)-N6)-dimethylallyltransferase MiaA n=1 Tax=Lichenicoccus sp. TaxID=2781899 RepID=UPI003D117B56